MTVPRWIVLVVCIVLPAVAYRVGGVGLWWILGAGYTVAAGLALRDLQDEGQLRAALMPRRGDAAWGFGAASVLYVTLFLLFRKVIAPGAYLPLCSTTGALYGQPGMHGLGLLFDGLRDRACAGFARSAGVRGPLRGAVIVAVSALEELAWRAGLQQTLATRLGSTRGYLVASGLFVVANLATGNPALALLALPAGVIFGGLYRLRGGLAAALFAHCTFAWFFFYNQPVLAMAGR